MTGPVEGPWTDAELDRWRTVGDEPADAAVAAYFASLGTASPGALMHSLVEHLDVPPEDRVPAIADFLAAAGPLPDWADPARLAAGQAVFGNLIVHQFTALYLASLPSAYAAARGVHVIWLTARLQDDPERRLNETAQFLMDVTAPGSFAARGVAVDRILHVRLMHAAVRWLIDHQDGVAHPADADPTARPAGPTWATSWGRPVNQEDLAGTMATFSTVVLTALRRSGVELDAVAEEDFVHLWAVIGHLLGIHDELLPRDLAAAEELQRAIFTRQQESSAVGRDLTTTLLGLLHDRVPRFIVALAPAMARRYMGDGVADMVGVPKSRIAKPILWLLVIFTRLTTRPDAQVPRWVSDRIGRRLMEGLLIASRHGDRVPFAIPETLGGVKSVVKVRAAVAGATGHPAPVQPASPPTGPR
jgi:hypothetical protein